MSGKTILFTEGGVGIAAGAPFTTFHYTIVTSVPTPTIANGRLAQLADAEQSIIAPGNFAGPTSFVLGNAVLDAVGGDNSVLIGTNIKQNSGGALQAEKQILIGNNIDMSSLSIGCTQLILIGDNFAFPVTGVQPDKAFSVVIGHNMTLNTPNQFEPYRNNVQIGDNSTLTGGGNVCVGDTAKALGSGCVAIGDHAQGNYYSVAIGNLAQSGLSGNLNDADVVIGWRTGGQPGSVVIGNQAGGNVISRDCVFIGWGSGNANWGGNVTDSICLGRESGTGSNNFCQIGGRAHPIFTLSFGSGQNSDNSLAGRTYIFRTTNRYGGFGNNNAKGDTLQVVPGTGTGNWPNAENLGFDLQLGLVQAAGATAQPPTSVLAARHSDLNVALWGGLAATFQGGTQVFFIGNSTAAPVGAPTNGVILYVVAGQLFGLGASGVATPLVL